MIYVTGDIHGNQFKWLEQIDPVLKEGDIIIVCGDFGIGFSSRNILQKNHFMISLVFSPILFYLLMAIMRTLISLIVIPWKYGMGDMFINYVIISFI